MSGFRMVSQLRLAVSFILVCLYGVASAATNSWSLSSPNGRCSLTLSIDNKGQLTYQAFREGRSVVENSPLGLARDDQNFAAGLALREAGKSEPHREQYELFSGTTPRVDHILNFRSVTFQNEHGADLIVDLAASEQGVAFRYRFPEHKDQVHVLTSELTAFKMPAGTRGWLQPYHAAGPYTPAYEDFYFHVSPGNPPPHSRGKPLGWAFPALFHSADDSSWVLLTESGTDASYCACHLDANSSNGLYRVAFPAADEATRHHPNKFGPEPRSQLPWTMPWRVIVLGGSAGDIAMASLVTDLAPPCRISDTSWIHPGRASWSWWAYPDGPPTIELFNKYSDFAARMGWEYTLFDAGWWKPGLRPIAQHARALGLTPLAWCFAGDFYEPEARNKKLQEIQSGGAQGVKVDFWCSDRQEAMAAMQGLFEAAAERHMVVNLHGCTIPRGWQRTWPNFLTAEAVLGTESYFYESRYTEKAAELNTVLPFTRNAIGPMDITPVACSPKKYARTTTAAHELAAALIFNSGIIHYADKPEFFESLPLEVQKILRDAPARWDETRCLIGEPGRMAVFARRSKNTWFIAGINGTGDAQPVHVELAGFGAFKKLLLVSEGKEPLMEVACSSNAAGPLFVHQIPPRGGFILRLDTK